MKTHYEVQYGGRTGRKTWWLRRETAVSRRRAIQRVNALSKSTDTFRFRAVKVTEEVVS